MLSSLPLLCMMLTVAQPNDRPWVALVVRSEGAVLERAKKRQVIDELMQRVMPGDFVTAPKTADMHLFFPPPKNLMIKVPAGSRIRITAMGIDPRKLMKILPKKLSKAGYRAIQSTVANGRIAGAVIRGEDIRGTLIPEGSSVVHVPAYADTILSTTPSFTWLADPKIKMHEIRLYNGLTGRERRLLWKARVATDTASLPKEKALTYGLKYQWEVLPVVDNRPGEPVVKSKFFVITEEQKKELREIETLAASKDQVDILLAALVYESHRVYGKALEAYKKLTELDPGRASYRLTLANYFELTGQVLEAKAQRDIVTAQLNPAPPRRQPGRGRKNIASADYKRRNVPVTPGKTMTLQVPVQKTVTHQGVPGTVTSMVRQTVVAPEKRWMIGAQGWHDSEGFHIDALVQVRVRRNLFPSTLSRIRMKQGNREITVSLEPGDVLTKIEGRSVTTTWDLYLALQTTLKPRELALEWIDWRTGKTMTGTSSAIRLAR